MTTGKWTLGREIGRGAYGVVYLATGSNGEKAAVKVCTRDAADPGRLARELRGAKLYRTIQTGEGLVRLLELGECEDGFYTVMELADDEFGVAGAAEYRPKTLARVIEGEKALPLDVALKLAITLTKGLVTLQRHHLLHRDVKPGNVIYVRGQPVLSDPGLLVDEAEAASLVGTPGYVPPERFTGSGADVYSLGLTLKAASFGRAVDELQMGPTLEADTGHPQFATWWRILNRATDPGASRRYRSAKALLNDLRRLQRRMVFTAKTLGLPRFVWLSILVTAVLLGVGVYKVKSSADESMARWRAQDEYIEQQKKEVARAVDEMVRRMKIDIEKSMKEIRR